MTSKKFIILLVLFAIATAVGVYDNFIKKDQTYIEPTNVIEYEHTRYKQ
ncbi:MAG: hypothetical protein IJN12_03675 [Clostridia bacterium]|nr:hypothetical protein [Clostridia bacterium]